MNCRVLRVVVISSKANSEYNFYNKAIATSNTEIIMNSVVIFFITDVDELLYGILTAINPDWVEGMSIKSATEDDEDDGGSSQDLTSEMEKLQKRLKLLEKQLARAGIITQSQDAGAWDERSDGSRKSGSQRYGRSRSPSHFKKHGHRRGRSLG